MTTHTTPPPQLREELVGAIAGHQRRRRRRQVVMSAAAVVLVIAVGVELVERNRDVPTEVVPASTTSTSIPTTTPAPSTGADEPEVVVFRPTDTPGLVVATSVNRGGMAVADLEEGRTHVYPSASTTLFGGGAFDSASIGPDHLYLYRQGWPPVPGRIFTLPASLDAVDRALIGDAPRPVELEGDHAVGRVVPISGGRAWVMGARSEDRPNLQLHILEADGTLRDVVVVDAHVIVHAAGDDAILEALGGESGLSRWLLVSPEGIVTELQAPSTAAGVLAASSDHLIWGGHGAVRAEIVIIDRASGHRIDVVAPEGHRWTGLGGPTIPSNSPGWGRTDPSGSRVLLGLLPSDSERVGDSTPTIVDLGTGEITRLPVPEGTTVAATQWASDGRSIIVVAIRPVEPSTRQNSVLRIDVDTGEVTDLGDVFPPGYHVVAAR